VARALATVDLPPIRDPSHYDDPSIVVDGVHDPVLADTYSVVVSTHQSYGSGRSRVRVQRIDRVSDAVAEWAL